MRFEKEINPIPPTPHGVVVEMGPIIKKLIVWNWVYGPLMRFEKEVYHTTHGGSGKVNPAPHGGSGRNGPTYQEIECMHLLWDLQNKLTLFPIPHEG